MLACVTNLDKNHMRKSPCVGKRMAASDVFPENLNTETSLGVCTEREMKMMMC